MHMRAHLLTRHGWAALVACLAVATSGCGSEERPASAAATTHLNSPPAQPAEAPPEKDEDAELEEREPAQLDLVPPGDLRAGSAERALAEFMDAWHDRAWDRMVEWTAFGYQLRNDDPAAELRERYRTRWLRGYFVQRMRLQPTMARARVLIEYRNVDPQLRREVLEMRLWREERDGDLSAEGAWGVDPLFTEQGGSVR